MEHVNSIVIGAGVVGLAVARELALKGLSPVIIERSACIGSGVSSRSSEVVHAGIYYEKDSLKARLCIRGKQLLYAYFAERGIEHRRCGKLIVAGLHQDLRSLDSILERGRANGVDDLRLISSAEAGAMEPALACAGAIYSPSSGIVDSHGLMTALLGDTENAGGILALASGFVAAKRDGDRWVCRIGGDDGFEISTTWLINCAGLHAQSVATTMEGFPSAMIPTLHLAKGSYFSLSTRTPFSHLVYPMPQDGGLGVHLTLDLGGQAKFGPDVQWLCAQEVEDIDYRVDESRKALFEKEIRSYWPGLPLNVLHAAYSGVRPKLSGPGRGSADYRIDGPRHHGVAGIVQTFGIESPGLTSCLAIAEYVVTIIMDQG